MKEKQEETKKNIERQEKDKNIMKYGGWMIIWFGLKNKELFLEIRGSRAF